MKKLLTEDLLHPYQERAVEHLMTNDKAGLLLEMGLGKTVSTLTGINRLIFEELEVEKVLIVAPKRVAENVWTSEIDKWAHLQHLTTSRIIGTAKQRQHALKEEADIYLIGRDNVAWLCGLFGGSMLPFDMLVLDESSSFKNPKSVRFKALKKVIGSFLRVVILTGTPAPNSLMDIWAQIFLLDQGERLGRFITKYRQTYFTDIAPKGVQYSKYRIRSDAEDAIYRKISDICISMKAEDYLDLPGRRNNYIDIDFGTKLKQKYDDFEREQVLEMLSDNGEEESITAMNAAALTTKLLQFANGAIYGNPDNPLATASKEVYEVHSLKLDAAEEIVENAQGRPVLIGWTFRHDRDRLLKRLKKYKPQTLEGEKEINAWNAGEIPVLLMHPASGGHGLNLQAGGNTIVWFGLPWSLELYQQFNARLDRQGQEQLVLIHHLIAKGTVDERVLAALEQKSGKQEALMQAVKALVKKYKK